MVRYNYDRIDVASNAKEINQVAAANIMLYPNGLLMAKIVKDPGKPRTNLVYTKHYYIGSERISAKIGTSINLGLYPQQLAETAMPQISHPVVRDPSDQSVLDAGEIVADVYAKFNQPAPAINSTYEGNLYTNTHENIGSTNYFYFHPDHLGSSSYITNKAGVVSQHMEYLPFGETMVDEHLNSYNSPFKYNAKEFDAETGNYYYGARYYDPKWSIFISVDPLAEKYPDISSYAYVANNPIIYIDPDGREIIGVTKKDAQNFKADIHSTLADKKFDGVRALIDVKGSSFKSIDVKALGMALDGVTLSTDERAYVDMVTNTINSTDMHKIEYLTGPNTSSEGATAFKDHMNNVQTGVGDSMVPNGTLSSALLTGLGGDGFNVPTKKGSHSFISSGVTGNERASTSGHEVFGHGIPSARGASHSDNNANAIRTDNLIRRILGMPQRVGNDHGGYKEGHITEPQKLPLTQ